MRFVAFRYTGIGVADVYVESRYPLGLPPTVFPLYSRTTNVSPPLTGTLTVIGYGEGELDPLTAGKVKTVSVGAGTGVELPANAVIPILMTPELVEDG